MKLLRIPQDTFICLSCGYNVHCDPIENAKLVLTKKWTRGWCRNPVCEKYEKKFNVPFSIVEFQDAGS